MSLSPALVLQHDTIHGMKSSWKFVHFLYFNFPSAFKMQLVKPSPLLLKIFILLKEMLHISCASILRNLEYIHRKDLTEPNELLAIEPIQTFADLNPSFSQFEMFKSLSWLSPFVEHCLLWLSAESKQPFSLFYRMN